MKVHCDTNFAANGILNGTNQRKTWNISETEPSVHFDNCCSVHVHRATTSFSAEASKSGADLIHVGVSNIDSVYWSVHFKL